MKNILLIAIMMLAITSALLGQTAFASDEFETKSVVRAELISKDKSGKVELDIQPGWHVNANPASMAFLIPTQVSLQGEKTKNIRYPSPDTFGTGLGNIKVYTGKATVLIEFAEDNSAHSVELTAQACNEQTCLAPSTWILQTNKEQTSK